MSEQKTGSGSAAVRITVRTEDGERSHDWDPNAGPATIGRADDCVIAIDSPYLSRTHCELASDGPQLVVRDLQSRNGTVVDGERIWRPTELTPDSTISLGPISISVDVSSWSRASRDAAPVRLGQLLEGGQTVDADWAQETMEEGHVDGAGNERPTEERVERLTDDRNIVGRDPRVRSRSTA